ncbi:MAG: acyl-CoA dehydrogenase family protein [Candidatus Thorarchaeota archaeon]
MRNITYPVSDLSKFSSQFNWVSTMTDYLSSTLWTDEELAFRKEVRAFCQKEISPIADEIDKGPYPRELIHKIGQAGYMGVHHEKSVGGTERGLSYEIIVAEEVSQPYKTT